MTAWDFKKPTGGLVDHSRCPIAFAANEMGPHSSRIRLQGTEIFNRSTVSPYPSVLLLEQYDYANIRRIGLH